MNLATSRLPDFVDLPPAPVRVVWLALVFALSTAGCAGSGTQRSFGSPEDLAAALQTGGGEELVRALDLEACGPGKGRGRSCSECEIDVVRPRLDERRSTAVVRVSCLQPLDLVVLRQDDGGRWSWIDTVSLMNRYGDLKVEFASLVQPPVQEIVVRNQEVGAGVGTFVGALWILKLVDGHISTVFSTGDSARLAWGTPDAPPPGAGGYAQTTELRYGEAAGLKPGRLSVVTNYDTPAGKYRLSRSYAWNDRWQTFTPTPPDEIAPVAPAR